MPLQQSEPQQRIAIALIVMAAVLAPLAPRASAQRFLGADRSRSSAPQVSVSDSAVVEERFALAQRMERLKEWDKAADVYQEIVDKYSDRVVIVSGGGAGGDDAKEPSRYASVSLKVQELL